MLEPLDRWDVVNRGRFEAAHDGHTWTVDVDFFDFSEQLRLYCDGIHVATRKSPARFEIGPGVRIEAAVGAFGMRKIELVEGAVSTTLAPAEGTAEAWRVGLARERPDLSRAIGVASFVVLVIAAVYGAIELIELTGVDAPLGLSAPVGVVLGFAALAAAIERALRLKSNRWLD